MFMRRAALWCVSLLFSAACSTPAPDLAPLIDASGGDVSKPVEGGPDLVLLGPPDGLPRGDVEADDRDAPTPGEAGAAGGEVGGADAPVVVEAAGGLDASPVDASPEAPVCAWPTPVDAGPGACRVGRLHLDCFFPEGATCDSGQSYTGTGGVHMLCVSDDPTGCPGCHPTSGTVTCTSQCAANQYVMSCGGPPMRAALDGGGYDPGYYEEPPAVCSLVTPTPSGMGFWCCPCP